MADFDSFVVFAEMRTGSNFLEANLNALDGVTCHGEAFNPHFIGYPNRDDILGVTMATRDADPDRLLAAIRAEAGLSGFRYFNDHDPRVLGAVLGDARVAKIVLTRNPIESYVSRKIAAATGQWKLTNVKNLRSETAHFDEAEFVAHLDRIQAFQVTLLNGLQRSGQTAFYLDYEDLQDVEVMNGLAAWLGVKARLDGLDRKLKKQNPAPLSAKVGDFDAMERALARLDRFDLNRTPSFEPRRGPSIPTFVAAPTAPLLYMPLRSGPEAAVSAWLSGLDGGAPVVAGFNQRTLREWMAGHPGHRRFTVLRHPLARAHAAFCERILPTGRGSFREIRENLRRTFKLPLPKNDVGDDYDVAAHRAAFGAFLTFLKANLGGQTALRVDPAWASQSAVLQGMAGFAPPDLLIREDEMAADLSRLAGRFGIDAPAIGATDPHHGALEAIYDAELEVAAREAYGRDYEAFGYGDWA